MGRVEGDRIDGYDQIVDVNEEIGNASFQLCWTNTCIYISSSKQH